MLIHVVVWKYKPETSEDEREEHRRKLRALKNEIEEIVDLKVGADVLHLARSYDTGLFSVFKDESALDAYTIHPAHQAVANLGKQIAQHVASVDFFEE